MTLFKTVIAAALCVDGRGNLCERAVAGLGGPVPG